MMASQSAPTIARRGANQVGLMNGKATYVPRAMWSQSMDNPMLDKSIEDATLKELRQFQMDKAKKTMVKSHLGQQMDENEQARQRAEAEKKAVRKLVDHEQERFKRDTAKQLEEHMKKQGSIRGTINAQAQELARRQTDARIREVQEAAELQIRAARQLCHELAARDRDKKQQHRELMEVKKAAEEQAAERRRQRQAANQEFSDGIKEALAQDECRLVAAQQRLRAAQAIQDANAALYARTAGKEDAERRRAEERRQDDDERMHDQRMDLHWSRREAARERQRQMMVQTLNAQMDARATRQDLDRVRTEADKQAIAENIREGLQKELERHKAKRSEEQQLQQELKAQMAQRYARDAQEGYTRPIACSTMKKAASSPSFGDLSSSMDASRHVAKPMGRTEDMMTLTPKWFGKKATDLVGGQKRSNGAPATVPMSYGVIPKGSKAGGGQGADGRIDRSVGLGGVVGCFGASTEAGAALLAFGGPRSLAPDRVLSKSMQLAEQDKLFDAPWSAGLSPAQLRKAGKAAAAARTKVGKAYRDYDAPFDESMIRRST